MRAQHTLTPFVASEKKRLGDEPRITVRSARNGVVLAELAGYSTTERRELATLFAAAPELRAALEPFVALNSSDATITITVRTADVVRARAAIAKATSAPLTAQQLIDSHRSGDDALCSDAKAAGATS